MSPTFGQTLRSQRHKVGKDLKVIAAETGISQSQLSHMELGRVSRPRPKSLERMALAYDIPYETLMILAGYAPTAPKPSLDLPAFIIEASAILTSEDWELLRGIVGHLVRGRASSTLHGRES